jgi:capsid assembly protease
MYDRILAEARTSVWLIRPDKLDAIMSLLENRAAGIQTDANTLRAFAIDNQDKRQTRYYTANGECVAALPAKTTSRAPKAIGVLPILGSIVQRGSMFTEASGTASTDTIGRQFNDMLKSEQVGTILLEVDSPGGTVNGINDLADKIQQARGIKPIVAIANEEAASAAYWLASAASEIVVTRSGNVGSIGAYAMHIDQSALNESLGVKPRYIAYGRYKTEGNPDEPLSDEAEAEIRKRVNRYGVMFEEAIAANRGVTLATVRESYGQGRMLDADAAKKAGMVDRVESFEAVIARLLSDRPKVKRRLAHAKNFLSSC